MSPDRPGGRRVLVSSTAGAGHVGPLLPVVDALARRGDKVLLVVPPELRETAERTGQPYRVGAAPPAGEVAAIWEQVPRVPAERAAVLTNRELFGRLSTAALLPAVEAAVREWRPQLVVREPCEYAAAVAASRYGVPQLQVAISFASVEWSAIELVAPALRPYGAEVVAGLRAAPYLTRFPAALDPSPFPATYRFREVPAGAAVEPLPDWWDGDRRPLVYATLGTVAGRLPVAVPAYRAIVAALAGLPVRGLLTVGRGVDPAALGPLPSNVRVRPWVEQARVLPEAAAVVCHGGSGTTFGAAAAGVPMVLLPLFADQPVNARRVAAAGAGLVVIPSPDPAGGMAGVTLADAERIAAAVETVVGDPAYRQAAGRIAADMARAPSLDHLLAGCFA